MGSDIQEQARMLALRIWLNCKAGLEYDQELAATEIAYKLALARRDTLEEAAKEFDKRFWATDERLSPTRDFRVDEFYKWLRAQAAKEPHP